VFFLNRMSSIANHFSVKPKPSISNATSKVVSNPIKRSVSSTSTSTSQPAKKQRISTLPKPVEAQNKTKLVVAVKKEMDRVKRESRAARTSIGARKSLGLCEFSQFSSPSNEFFDIFNPSAISKPCLFLSPSKLLDSTKKGFLANTASGVARLAVGDEKKTSSLASRFGFNPLGAKAKAESSE
jgi:hypothetical protein